MLISAAVTVVSAVVIYLIYACGMQERTYEEVMAEQRRLHQSEVFTCFFTSASVIQYKLKHFAALVIGLTFEVFRHGICFEFTL